MSFFGQSSAALAFDTFQIMSWRLAMKRTIAHFLFLLGVTTALVIGALPIPARAFDIFNDMPPNLIGWDSNSEIHIHSAAQADAVRQNIVNYLWNGRGLPTAAASTVSSGNLASYSDVSLLNSTYISSVEKWQANMDFGYSTSMYLLHPAVTNSNTQRLAIVHHGHVGMSNRYCDGIGTLTDHLLQNGFTVLEMEMPLTGWNSQTSFNLPSGTQNLSSHNAMVSSLEGQNGSSLRFFLEPVVQGINKFVQSNPNYTDVSMFGISGGGWTTTLASAIDPRIKVNVPVAGSLPLTIRDAYAAAQGYGYNDDAEQELAAMYINKATYEDLYALDGYGPGRKSIQLNNQFDNCCFYGVSSQTYATNVSNAVAATGAGSWKFYLDTTANTHQISSNAVYNVMDPALGISPAKPSAPAINSQFNVVSSSPPTGWRYDPTNGAAMTISCNGTQVVFPANGGVKSIVSNSTFDPKAVPTTATMKIDSIGSGGYLGLFFTDDPYARTHHFGLQVNSAGQLLLNTDHGGGYSSYTLANLTGYTGGPITLKLMFDSTGFTASTDVGNFSVSHPYSWIANAFTINDLGGEAFPFLQYYGGSNVGKVDSFTIAATDFIWNQTTGGSWSLGTNWTAGSMPTGAGVAAKFTNSINTGATVNMDAAVTLGKLLFNNAKSYKITGSSTLTLSPGYLGTNQIEVDAGNHEIAVPLLMNVPTEVAVAAGSTLTLSGIVSGAGNLIKSGDGNLILTQNTAYLGDTTVNGGTLTLLGALNSTAGHVKVNAGSVLTAKSLKCDTLTIGGPTTTAVPEPNTLVILTLGGILSSLYMLWLRR
jgi:autotransporter-associated beta strand protein